MTQHSMAQHGGTAQRLCCPNCCGASKKICVLADFIKKSLCVSTDHVFAGLAGLPVGTAASAALPRPAVPCTVRGCLSDARRHKERNEL